ncbi:hypothetical protein GRS48_13870 [Halorubrum sp. JWXQ-INN 858]|uniref:zinc ribbon domain-containing protein n=1 Tax=Halorubrum sp. JWXQ-INN 858 TaxID=2690782 RepID=UPI001358F8D9|nr:zinc ribbon domain-containing protein [Halorubrum sp. JWXQ-INN 858]MWV65897.1 hypothetical protein [Halorubrum sp. JWXQ-INN 858]
MYCRNCGEEVKLDSKYCSACGKVTGASSNPTNIEGESEDSTDRYTTDDAVGAMDSVVQSGASILAGYSRRAAISTLGGLLIIFSFFFTYQQASALGFEMQGTGLQIFSVEDILTVVALSIMIITLSTYRWNSRTASLCVIFGFIPLLSFIGVLLGYNFPDPEVRAFVQPGFGLYLLGLGSFLVVTSSSHKAIQGFWQYIRE